MHGSWFLGKTPAKYVGLICFLTALKGRRQGSSLLLHHPTCAGVLLDWYERESTLCKQPL